MPAELLRLLLRLARLLPVALEPLLQLLRLLLRLLAAEMRLLQLALLHLQ